jgi:hypothetical protein
MNHQKNAESFLDDAECSFGEGSMGAGNQYVALAQTHAILAVAEQLRIGNLIALTNAGSNPTDDSAEWGQQDEVRRRAYNGLIDFMEYDHLTTYPVLNPQVAEALGIEQP